MVQTVWLERWLMVQTHISTPVQEQLPLLLSLVEPLLRQEQYLVLKYCEVLLRLYRCTAAALTGRTIQVHELHLCPGLLA